MPNGEKILIIDDENDICNFLKENLTLEGYEVTIANSGGEALLLLKATWFDVLIVDMRLEGRLSGVDVIKEYGQNVRRPKIIIMSATPHKYLEPLLAEERIERFVDYALEKPGDMAPGILAKILKKLLNK